MIRSYETKSGKRWLYRYEKGGQSFRGRGYLTKGDAKTAEAQSRLAGVKIDTGYLSEIASEYLDYVERNQTAKTYSQKKSHIKKLIKFAGDIPVRDLSPHVCQKFLDGFPNTASNTHRKTLFSWMKWCIDMQIINILNPLTVVKPKPKTKFIKYIPPQEHIFMIMLNAQGNQRDFIRSVYYTLARRGEIINLKVGDVDFQRSTVVLRTKKRTGEARERTIRMPVPFVEIMQAHCQGKSADNYVFNNEKTSTKYFDMNTVLPRLCKKAGIKPFTFHAIRHYGASYLAQHGYSAKDIQQLLGHSELRTTEIYLHDLKNVAEGVDGLEVDPTFQPKTVNIAVNQKGKVLNLQGD